MNTQKTDKKRVVAYARVSTNKNDQANSLENQTTYFKRELERDSRYQLVKINIENICDSGIYYDKGTSGTKLSTDYACKVVCGKCGAFYTASGRRYYATEGKTLRRYTCRHAYVFDEQSGIPKCNNPAIRESTLDNALNSKSFYEKRLESIEELLVMSDYYIEILNNSVDSDNAREVKRIEDEITKAITAREKIIKLYAEGTFSKEELDRLNNEYTNQIGELTEKKQILSSGNSEIYKRINQLNSLKKEAQKEYKKAKKIVETKQYPKTDRKALLREVDRIVIDIDGNPNIVFKSVSVIDEYIRSMDSTISTYIEASADKTAVKKTLSEVISEFEDDEK
ncbi:MAG: recombinase zinc beta ribbon domain-containing protein [Mogibacterium sp.]|nr:recombinase zinc beta ribbon domain-containing protein [Mogibacterium sp.]MBR0341930.1 recombinase zinc beta ribbon domain-containing protein [Oscillospiraceae bacterium]